MADKGLQLAQAMGQIVTGLRGAPGDPVALRKMLGGFAAALQGYGHHPDEIRSALLETAAAIVTDPSEARN